MTELVDALVRILHIGSGVMMVGGVIFWSALAVPTLEARLAPEHRAIAMRALFPRVSAYLTWAGVVAILSGFLLLARIFGWRSMLPVLTTGAYGWTLLAGALAVLVMMVLALTIIQPSGRELLDGRGDARTKTRLVAASGINIVLALGVLISMATAVSLRT